MISEAASARLEEGDTRGARAEIERGLRLVAARGPVTFDTFRFHLLMLRVNLREAERGDPVAELDELERAAREVGSQHYLVLCALRRACGAFDRDDPEGVERARDSAEATDPREYRAALRTIPSACGVLSDIARGRVAGLSSSATLPQFAAVLLEDLGLPAAGADGGPVPIRDWAQHHAALAKARARLVANDPSGAISALSGLHRGGLHLHLLAEIERAAAHSLESRSTLVFAEVAERVSEVKEPFLQFRLHLAQARSERAFRRDPSEAITSATALATTWRRRRELFRFGFGAAPPFVDGR